MVAPRLAALSAGFVLTLAGFALVGWWLLWPLWSRPPPALMPPPLSLLLQVLAALSVLARAGKRPSGWSSAPALLVMVLAAMLLLEAAADVRGGLAFQLSPDAVQGAEVRAWRPSLLLGAQSLVLGASLWSLHGRRKPAFDLGDGLAVAALALGMALFVREPGGAATAALLLAAGVIALEFGRGLPVLVRRIRLPQRKSQAVAAKVKVMAEVAVPPTAAESDAEPVPVEAAPRPRMAQLPPTEIDPKTGFYTEAGWKKFLAEEDGRCALTGASGCVLVLEPKPNDDVAALEQIPQILSAAARQGDVITRTEVGYIYLGAGCPPEQAPGLLAKLRSALSRAGVQVWIGVAMRDLNRDFPSTVEEAVESKNSLRASSTGMHR